jgi:hypothetical protein
VRRTIVDDDHEMFRKMVRAFMEDQIVPAFPDWEKAGCLPRSFFTRLGELGRENASRFFGWDPFVVVIASRRRWVPLGRRPLTSTCRSARARSGRLVHL